MAKPPRDATYDERLASRQGWLHIAIGVVCNNRCLFCMEEDREKRAITNAAMTPERVRWLLETERGAPEVCFVAGEPTTRQELPTFVAWARELGYPRIGVMTNGRRLSYAPYATALLRAGLNRAYVSLHAHTAELHEGLTRAPGSFAQTVAGIRTMASLRPPGFTLNTSTVVNKRNLPHLGEIYRFLRGLGVDQVVFNVMKTEGGGETHFEPLFPRYREIAAAFARVCREAGQPRPPTFLVDIPPCTTTAVPDFNRGFVEHPNRFETRLDHAGSPGEDVADSPGLARIRHVEGREKRGACASCRHDPVCPGVWSGYLARNGWEEFEPVQ